MYCRFTSQGFRSLALRVRPMDGKKGRKGYKLSRKGSDERWPILLVTTYSPLVLGGSASVSLVSGPALHLTYQGHPQFFILTRSFKMTSYHLWHRLAYSLLYVTLGFELRYLVRLSRDRLSSSDTSVSWFTTPTCTPPLPQSAQLEKKFNLYYNLNTWQPINHSLNNYKPAGINI